MTELQQRVLELKKEKNALILSHVYQMMKVQKIADKIGDSFELAKYAKAAPEPVIILCGVRFMAESAKLLCPDKRVYLPAPDAGCPMADMITAEDVLSLREKYPDAAVCCYVNTSAEVKAVSDICCTSSSAVRIIRSLPEKRIIFIPDKNLGAYVSKTVPEKELIFFEGYCPIHNHITVEMVDTARRAHPGVTVAVHPECRPEVCSAADFVGSTAQIVDFALKNSGREFIIGTEMGVAERIMTLAPEKRCYLLTPRLICPNMKRTDVSDVLRALQGGEPPIEIPSGVADSARACLDRMVSV